MFSRTERCSSEVSWLTRPMAERRLSCVTSRTSCPSMRDAPALHVEQTQQQVHQRRLAGARAADQTHLLARLDGEVEALDHACLPCRASS